MAEVKISAAEVKALRDRTGAGMMDCKAALQEAGGDTEKAIEILRKKGAALVEVQCETDFVARNEDFLEFARQVAIHVTAMNPQHVSFDEIPEEDRENERRILSEKAKEDGKPDDVIERIVEGQLKKWASEIVLLDQKHFNEERYEGKTIQELRTEVASKTGENVRIARFSRFEVGGEVD